MMCSGIQEKVSDVCVVLVQPCNLTDVCIESQLATAPTNGCVILWDINKRTKSKIGKLKCNGLLAMGHLL